MCRFLRQLRRLNRSGAITGFALTGNIPVFYWLRSANIENKISKMYWLLLCSPKMIFFFKRGNKHSTESVWLCACSRHRRKPGVCYYCSSSSIYRWQCVWPVTLSDQFLWTIFTTLNITLVWKMLSAITACFDGTRVREIQEGIHYHITLIVSPQSSHAKLDHHITKCFNVGRITHHRLA